MKVLLGKQWRSGFLDPWCGPSDRRLHVRRWVIVEELRDLAIAQPRDVRRLLDYGRAVGPREAARKVVSRLHEEQRGDRVAACGLGVDVDSGERFAFFAPLAPRALERVVVARDLTWPVGAVPLQLEVTTHLSDDFRRWSAWTPASGRALEGLDDLEQLVRAMVQLEGEPVELGLSSPVRERLHEPVEGGRLHATVFGYGHYVRTVLLPSLPSALEVSAIHELDPLLAPDGFPTVDTAPLFRSDEAPDVTFVAGFHASHAPLSAEALRRGSWVVAEKPLATTVEQLDDLLEAWIEPSRFFAAFQRRFMAANQWAMEDLEPDETNPMSYHALVHEVSLPARHWYRWPASGSRLLSNGCHWIDHFLYLNDFAEVVALDARQGPNGELGCEITLENGAYFTLTLSDRGSDRLGVREHTELRVSDRTAIIEDMSSYHAEGPRGPLRSERFHRQWAHRAMYDAIGHRILAGKAGDSRASVERTARTVLELEARLRGAGPRRP